MFGRSPIVRYSGTLEVEGILRMEDWDYGDIDNPFLLKSLDNNLQRTQEKAKVVMLEVPVSSLPDDPDNTLRHWKIGPWNLGKPKDIEKKWERYPFDTVPYTKTTRSFPLGCLLPNGDIAYTNLIAHNNRLVAPQIQKHLASSVSTGLFNEGDSIRVLLGFAGHIAGNKGSTSFASDPCFGPNTADIIQPGDQPIKYPSLF